MYVKRNINKDGGWLKIYEEGYENPATFNVLRFPGRKYLVFDEDAYNFWYLDSLRKFVFVNPLYNLSDVERVVYEHPDGTEEEIL